MIRQISDSESDGFKVVSSFGADVEGTGSSVATGKRLLADSSSNLSFENPKIIYNASF